MKLSSDDMDLLGQWLLKGNKVVADETCRRIEWLVDLHLIHLGSDASGWDDLYRDPIDGRLWERTWPKSEMHGGGPPRLRCVTVDDARKKYGAIADG